VVNIVMFLVPGLLMTLCYSLIVAKLHCSSAPGERLGLPASQARAKRKVGKTLSHCLPLLCFSMPLFSSFFSSSAVFYFSLSTSSSLLSYYCKQPQYTLQSALRTAHIEQLVYLLFVMPCHVIVPLTVLHQVVKLVLVVIAAFFLCWSPHQLLMAHAILSTDSQVINKLSNNII
jgi:hypothetical protein